MTNFRMHGFSTGADVALDLDQDGNAGTARSQHYGEDSATYVARKKSEMNPMVDHGGDMTKMTEHMKVMALIPKADATHTMIRDGSFFDPNSWDAGTVPGNSSTDKAFIPDDVICNIDGFAANPFQWLRVDGAVFWARDTNTRLICDTIISTHGSVWDQGTEASPIPGTHISEVHIVDDTDIDVAKDEWLQGRCVMLHGEVFIHGQNKDSWLLATTIPTTGATSVALASAPTNWNVGDTIVIPGTDRPGFTAGAFTPNKDEVRIIAGIEGNIVSWDAGQPLVNARTAPSGDLKIPVINLTRNVKFKSQSENETWPNQVHRRGHFMCMHNAPEDVDIRYLECAYLGRTSKGHLVDPETADKTDVVTQYNTLGRSVLPQHLLQWPEFSGGLPVNANVQGRYSLHLHKFGVKSRSTTMAKVWGCSVYGSPGLGIVHHTSHAWLKENVVFDVFGTGVFAEAGGETGVWESNVVIGGRGVNEGVSKNVNFKATNTDPLRPASLDGGRGGDGYWFQGRLIESHHNYAASVSHGFNYSHRDGQPSEAYDWTTPNETYELDAGVSLAGALGFSEPGNPIPALLGFRDNTVFAANNGMVVEKENPFMGHEIHSVVRRTTAWNLKGSGLKFGYTGHYIIKDNRIENADTGIHIGLNAIGLVVSNNSFKNCVVGIGTTRGATQGFTAGELGLVFINNTANMVNVAAPFSHETGFWDADYPSIVCGSTDIPPTDGTPPDDTFVLVGNPASIDINGPLTWTGSASGGGFAFPHSQRSDDLSSLGGTDFNAFPYHPDPTGLPPVGQGTTPRAADPDPINFLGTRAQTFLTKTGYWYDGVSKYYSAVPVYFSDRSNGQILVKWLFGESTAQNNMDTGTYHGVLSQAAFSAAIPAHMQALGCTAMNTVLLVGTPS